MFSLNFINTMALATTSNRMTTHAAFMSRLNSTLTNSYCRLSQFLTYICEEALMSEEC